MYIDDDIALVKQMIADMEEELKSLKEKENTPPYVHMFEAMEICRMEINREKANLARLIRLKEYGEDSLDCWQEF